MTTKDELRLTDYLGHILQAIERIFMYIEDIELDAFAKDPKTQDAVIRNFEIIGEASNNVRQKFREFADAHPEIPWRLAYELRNVLAHGYFKIDLETVWTTIHNQLPDLAQRVNDARNEIID